MKVHPKKITIAIDGYSSCGKSTLAKYIAEKYAYVYIDTGAMYRAVALFFLRNGVMKNGKIDTEQVLKILPDIQVSFRYNAQTGKAETWLNGENVEEKIRGMEVSENVSKVSQLPEVRKKMVSLQQEMGKAKGVVMDGRDIGTVVFPDAELKFFITASPTVRIERRFLELQKKGMEVSREEVEKNINERDFNDLNRELNPLKQADEAHVIDNSSMSIDEQNKWVSEIIDNTLLRLA